MAAPYFNSYYNAKTAFNEGYTIHQKIMRNYPDSLVTTPPEIARTKYERAIAKSIKVLDIFPKDKKWHDDAVFLMGKAYFYKKDFSKAIRHFMELQQEYPQSPYIPESYVYLGMSYIEEDELSKAEETLQLVLDRYPNVDTDQRVSLLLVEIAIRREGRSQAIELLQKIRGKVRSEETRIDLLLRVSELYIEMGQYHKAIALLRNAPRKKDLPIQSYRMDMALVISYIQVDSLPAALKLTNTMSSNRIYYSHRNEILFKKGIILEKMGRIDDAIAVFIELTKDVGDAMVSSDTSSTTGKAFLELAILYQTQKEDYKTATVYFEKASKSRDTVCAAVGSRRLNAIKRINALREDTTAHTKGERFYKVAELFRYELDEPDSAYLQYIALSKDTSSDSLLAPRSLCAAAIVARDELGKKSVSDSLFKSILENYPASEFAKRAESELKIPKTVKTRQDSAREAFTHAENLFYKENKNDRCNKGLL